MLQRTQPGTASILCTHLWVIRQLLAEALGETADHGLKIDVPTASVSIIDYPEGTWPLLIADGSHGLHCSRSGAPTHDRLLRSFVFA